MNLYNNSTVWNGEFNTDQEVFDLLLKNVSRVMQK